MPIKASTSRKACWLKLPWLICLCACCLFQGWHTGLIGPQHYISVSSAGFRVHYTCKKKKKKKNAKQKKPPPKQRTPVQAGAASGGVQKKKRKQGHSKQDTGTAKS